MERRKYTREFKLETVNMMKGRGVSLACPSSDHLAYDIWWEPVAATETGL